jgi:hypothetical protein
MSIEPLNRFNPRILEYKRTHGHAPIMVFVAKRGCGKSVLIADIVSYLKVPSAIVISGTEEANGFYSKHVHSIYVYGSYDPAKIENIIKVQKKKGKIIQEKFGKKLSDFPELGVLIIMDDIAYDSSLMKDPSIKEIFFNGRHYNITLVMSLQYLVAMPPAYRTNVDFVFAGREVTKEHMDKLYKYFFGIYSKPADFRASFNKYTEDYCFMVLDRTCKSEKIEDNVFWYKGRPGV